MKELILLRGLPGAGKSTLAGVLAEERWPALSVDDYFTDPENGDYAFEYDKNHLAYKSCQDRAENFMKEGKEKIFVHNTFTLDWEMKPYVEMAGRYGYRLHVVTVEKHHEAENVHGVSSEQIRKMAEKYWLRLF